VKIYDYNESVIVGISNSRVYHDFIEMLQYEDPDKIVPGYDKENLLNLLRNFYSAEKEALGVVVFEILPLN